MSEFQFFRRNKQTCDDVKHDRIGHSQPLTPYSQKFFSLSTLILFVAAGECEYFKHGRAGQPRPPCPPQENP